MLDSQTAISPYYLQVLTNRRDALTAILEGKNVEVETPEGLWQTWGTATFSECMFGSAPFVYRILDENKIIVYTSPRP